MRKAQQRQNQPPHHPTVLLGSSKKTSCRRLRLAFRPKPSNGRVMPVWTFNTLDRRKANAQSLLSRAWRSCVARRQLARSREEASLFAIDRANAMRAQALAKRLASDRRATSRTVRKKKVFGTHLNQLFTVVPQLQGPVDRWDKMPGTELSSPIEVEGSFSARWLVGNSNMASRPASSLSPFQGETPDRAS
jgi:hypothetical protein